MNKKKLNIKKIILKSLLSIAIIAIIIVILYFVLKHFNLLDITQEQIQDKVSSFGVLGPIIFIIISFLQVTLVPIPGAVTILAGNYLFGPLLSFIYSYIGMFLGALFAFLLGRVLGKPFVNWLVGDVETVDYYLNKFKGKETIILFFMFLFPFFPDDILCSIGGIMPISWQVFILIQLITRATSIGGTLLFMSGEIIPYEGWGLALIILLCIAAIILFIISYVKADKINDALIKFIDKTFKRKK